MLQSENIILRSFSSGDAVDLYKLKSDFNSARSFSAFPFPFNLESLKEWIVKMYAPGLQNSVYFAIEEKQTKIFGGYCVARKIDYISRNAEVGIWFSETIRGKGFYYEVSILFYKYLFNELGMHKLYSYDIEDNFVIGPDKKIGFVEEGRMKEHLWQDGKYKDLVFVSLFKDDFLHFIKSC